MVLGRRQRKGYLSATLRAMSETEPEIIDEADEKTWKESIPVVRYEDHKRPLKNAKHEKMAQRMALGSPRYKAYTEAGYKSKTAPQHSYYLINQFPSIEKRVEFLKDKMFQIQVTQEIISPEEIMKGLVDNVRAASLGHEVFSKNGDIVGHKTDFGAVNRGYQILAELNGMVIKRSEKTTKSDDPLDGATDEQLLYTIARAAEELGMEIDTNALRESIGLVGFASEIGRADGDEEET